MFLEKKANLALSIYATGEMASKKPYTSTIGQAVSCVKMGIGFTPKVLI